MARAFLQYTVHLTDAARVAELQALSSAGSDSPGAVIKAPTVAAEEYSAPILEGDAPFAAPCTSSPWFATTEYPQTERDFERRGEGFWGFVKSLFGAGKTHFYWRGSFVLAPLLEGPSGTPGESKVAIATRHFIEGFESGVYGTGACRAASRHTQGFGYCFDDTATQVTANANPDPLLNGVPAQWERAYLRIRRYPAGAPVRLWTLTCVPSSGDGLGIELLPSGDLTLRHFVVSTGPPEGALIAALPKLALNVWTRLDLLCRPGQNPSPLFRVFLNGVEAPLAIVWPTEPSGSPGVPPTPQGFARATNQVSQTTFGFNGDSHGCTWHLDDWIGADLPTGGTDGSFPGLDWLYGSRVAWVAAQAFGPDHAADWLGDWRATRARPLGQANQTLLSNPGDPDAPASVVTDAGLEVDATRGVLGAVALRVDVNGQGGADARLGYQIPGDVAVLEPIVLSPAGGFGSVTWRPAGLLDPVPTLAGTTLTVHAGPAASTATILHLSAQVEVLGYFGPEDVPASAVPPVPPASLPRGRQVSLHNAPYPRTIWALPGPPPLSPVLISGGTYTGTGTAQDLAFPCPIHWLWIRPADDASATGILWTSAMNAAHNLGHLAYEADAPVQVLTDATFVQAAAVLAGHEVPQTPSTLAEAVTLANALAYGFAKHSAGDSVWANYANDPAYYFKRMLGWQAGGADVAVFGAYAEPVTDWGAHDATVEGSSQAQQTLVRLVGDDTASNADGQVYQFVAVADPGGRFFLAGALQVGNGPGPVVSTLDDEAFVPEACFLQHEIVGNASNEPHAFYKGLGHAAAAVSPLHAAQIEAALTFGTGTLTADTALHHPGSQVAYGVFRRNDGSGVDTSRVLQLASYVGDGSASRTVGLAPPSGRRPLWGMVVPQDGPTVWRDPSHTGTSSSRCDGGAVATGGITGGGLDSLSVGVELNTAGVGYDVFVIPGSTTACQNGWGCNGTFVPVPVAPGTGGWDPTPADPDDPDVDPTDPTDPDPGDGTGGGTPDFSLSCVAASTRVVNQALSRIGISQRIGVITTEASEAADTARLHYQEDVDATLRDFPWPFATRYATLVRVAGTPAVPVNGDWTYSYRAPAAMLQARRIVKPGGVGRGWDPTPIEFRLGSDATGALLYCREATVELEYTVRPPCAATAGDAQFRSALAWRHAHSLAPSLSRDERKVAYCWAMYQQVLTTGKTTAASEQQQPPSGEADWITGRD